MGVMMTCRDQFDALSELLEVIALRGPQRILPEEWDDHLQQFRAPSHDETIQMFFVVVVPPVGDDLTYVEELSNRLQAVDALGTLRDGEFVRHLIAGLVASSVWPIWLSDEPDREAAFSVYKTNNPAEKDQPFLLIVRTQHVVTTFRMVVWDTRSFQHMAECSSRHY